MPRARLELRESTATPAPGARLRFTATAYCKGTTTASGVNVRTGIAAADPDLLPVGSVIQVDRLGERYNGIYTIMDTGPAVQGRHIDIYMWSCNEALEFGPPRRRHHRPPPRLEPARQHAEPDRPPVPPARGAAAAAAQSEAGSRRRSRGRLRSRMAESSAPERTGRSEGRAPAMTADAR